MTHKSFSDFFLRTKFKKQNFIDKFYKQSYRNKNIFEKQSEFFLFPKKNYLPSII
jgi:hypothetical protein